MVLDAVVAKEEVDVAEVVVEFTAVKFWRVVEERKRVLVRVARDAKRFVEDAVVAKKEVEVALEEVLFKAVKFWRVEEAEARKPPVKVVRPETVREPRVPTEVRDELTTPDPKVVPERTAVLLTRYALPEAILMSFEA